MDSMWHCFVHCTFNKAVLACGGYAAAMPPALRPLPAMIVV